MKVLLRQHRYQADTSRTSSHCSKRCMILSTLAVISTMVLLQEQDYLLGSSVPVPNSFSTASVDKADDLDPVVTAQRVEGMTVEQVDELLVQKGLDPLPKPQNDVWKLELLSRIDRIRLLCGTLCTLNSIERIQEFQHHLGPFFLTIKVDDVNCPNLLSMKDIDAGDMTFPSHIPEELEEFYTLNGAYPIQRRRVKREAYLGGEASTNVWTKNDIDEAIQQLREGTLRGTYKQGQTTAVRETLASVDMKGKSVLVIGSQSPWLECICLYHSAAKVTTLEYGRIQSYHPQIMTETPESFRSKYLNGTLGLFDGILTHSSLEHSGLGRYGDALNPWGDILAMARAWCVAKIRAFLYLALPEGRDLVL